MNKIEFIHKFYFDYDKRTIYELCEYYGFNYENSKMYLDSIYYIEDKYYVNRIITNFTSEYKGFSDFLFEKNKKSNL